ncbi:MAG TPA: Mov34/MPN/PAD-1 family protein [Gemmataceae bacterium]|nr:Mov34/MPN/PAD-1 family protein [Gemmataceae bacterium]
MRRIAAIDWLQALLGKGQRWLARRRGPGKEVRIPPAVLREPGAAPAQALQPLKRVLVTAEVARVMFGEYAAHRVTERGEEEIGWVLLGRRDLAEATVLASLPAGADRESGEAHVRFNSVAQIIASRFVRQRDRRIGMLGVVHTHPGSLRHPSDGDYRGDIEWVGQLRGGEGIFGIGTADGKFAGHADEIWSPRDNIQALGDLCLTWYSLRSEARNYRTIPVELIDGPDLAAPLRTVWPILEEHGDRLDRLAQQIAKVSFEVIHDEQHSSLAMNVVLPGADRKLRAVLGKKEILYFLVRDGAVLAADLRDPYVDRGIYRLLADVAEGV